MALQEYKHHSSRGRRKDRAGEEGHRDKHDAPRRQKSPPQNARPPCLGEPRGPQLGVQRHCVEDMGNVCPFVQILDLPVPQMADTVLEFFRLLDLPVAEQGIEVRKVSSSSWRSWAVLRAPQVVDF